jgi:hypothetical protein
MRFVIEVRIEDGDHSRPPPVTVGVIERSADLTPASGLGLFLQETKDLLRELQAVVVAGQTAQFVSAASKCRTCSTTLGVKDRKQLVYRTAFGIARLASPRLYSRCARCGRWRVGRTRSARWLRRFPNGRIRSGRGCSVAMPASCPFSWRRYFFGTRFLQARAWRSPASKSTCEL